MPNYTRREKRRLKSNLFFTHLFQILETAASRKLSKDEPEEHENPFGFDGRRKHRHRIHRRRAHDRAHDWWDPVLALDLLPEERDTEEGAKEDPEMLSFQGSDRPRASSPRVSRRSHRSHHRVCPGPPCHRSQIQEGCTAATVPWTIPSDGLTVQPREEKNKSNPYTLFLIFASVLKDLFLTASIKLIFLYQ